MAANNFTNILNRLFPWRRAHLNRKFKDHLFRFLFREKNELLSLYNAVNGTDYTDPDALTIMTLEDAIYLRMKNDVSFLIDGRLSLYEHQSSICPNMPLRGLFYFSQMLQGYVDQNNLNIYSSTKVSLPLPLYIVFQHFTTFFVLRNKKTYNLLCLVYSISANLKPYTNRRLYVTLILQQKPYFLQAFLVLSELFSGCQCYCSLPPLRHCEK